MRLTLLYHHGFKVLKTDYLSFSLMPVPPPTEVAKTSDANTIPASDQGTPQTENNIVMGDILQSALAAAAIPSTEAESEGVVQLSFDAPIQTIGDPTPVAAEEISFISNEPEKQQEATAEEPDDHNESPNLAALLNDVSLPEPDSLHNTTFSEIIEGKTQTSFSEALMLPRPTRQSSPKKYSTELEFLPKTPTKNGGRSGKDQLLETPLKSVGLETPTKSTMDTPRKLFETPYKNSDNILSWFGSSEDLTVTDSNLPNLIMTEDSNPPQQPVQLSRVKNHPSSSNGRVEPVASTSTPSSASSSTSISLHNFLNENSRDSIISNSSVDFSLQSLLNENSMDYVNKFADLASHISGNNNQNLETPKKNK